MSNTIRFAEAVGINLPTLLSGWPDSDGIRQTPNQLECKRILKRLGVEGEDSNKYLDACLDAKGNWGMPDALLWLDTPLRLDEGRWKPLAAAIVKKDKMLR